MVPVIGTYAVLAALTVTLMSNMIWGYLSHVQLVLSFT